jgi:hypothetical protein
MNSTTSGPGTAQQLWEQLIAGIATSTACMQRRRRSNMSCCSVCSKRILRRQQPKPWGFQFESPDWNSRLTALPALTKRRLGFPRAKQGAFAIMSRAPGTLHFARYAASMCCAWPCAIAMQGQARYGSHVSPASAGDVERRRCIAA